MAIQLVANEAIIKEGQANHQRGIESVGGKLYLTTQRLHFESHDFNFQTGETIIPLWEIVSVVPERTKFLNLIPMLSNSIKVTTRNGQEEKFVVWGKDEWIYVINNYSAQWRR